MKKFSKTLLCGAIALILGTGSAFAKGRNGMKPANSPKMVNKNASVLNQNGTPSQKTVLIGQISSVDEKAGILKISDADGKEFSVTVIPFTKVRINDSKEEKNISDLTKGDWVLYSVYNTDTEQKIASRIFVKK